MKKVLDVETIAQRSQLLERKIRSLRANHAKEISDLNERLIKLRESCPHSNTQWEENSCPEDGMKCVCKDCNKVLRY